MISKIAVLIFGLAVHASNVQTLTSANFDSVLDRSIPALVEFYAPWY